MSLNLVYCTVDDKGMEAISQLLSENNILTELNIGQNYIRGVNETKFVDMLLKNNGISTLIINSNPISSLFLEDFSKVIQNNGPLHHLNMSCCRLNNPSALKMFQLLRQHLNLLENRIGDDGIEAISTALFFNNTIKELILKNNKLSEKSVIMISQLLVKNGSIHLLDLRECLIEIMGGVKLADSLQSNTSLTHLYLAYNDIQEAGAKQFAQSLLINSTMKVLDMGIKFDTNSIGNLEINHLYEVMKINKTVKII